VPSQRDYTYGHHSLHRSVKRGNLGRDKTQFHSVRGGQLSSIPKARPVGTKPTADRSNRMPPTPTLEDPNTQTDSRLANAQPSPLHSACGAVHTKLMNICRRRVFKKMLERIDDPFAVSVLHFVELRFSSLIALLRPRQNLASHDEDRNDPRG